ncbi:MAG: CDP-diacylglycerol--glycerol-3-phosphate 3-phosphatidyltransferase [Rhodothermales bacterium]|nr:CDP-diacylglycerol--glycerol-3-phosphate 3-phosphatidyltransferase [Rhodothermales bacterium]
MKYLPNTITILRILVTPAVLVFLLRPSTSALFWAWALFIIAAISDYVDGSLARRLEVPSRLGQFLDPLADKVLVIGTFIVLAYKYPAIVPVWVVVVIAIRAMFVTALRSWVESRGQSLRTLGIAKLKTVAQLTFLIGTLTILLAARLPGFPGDIGAWILGTTILYVLAAAVAVITAATGLIYLFTLPAMPHESA